MKTDGKSYSALYLQLARPPNISQSIREDTMGRPPFLPPWPPPPFTQTNTNEKRNTNAKTKIKTNTNANTNTNTQTNTNAKRNTNTNINSRWTRWASKKHAF